MRRNADRAATLVGPHAKQAGEEDGDGACRVGARTACCHFWERNRKCGSLLRGTILLIAETSNYSYTFDIAWNKRLIESEASEL